MLRSPTHIVGHGPTSHTTTTTNPTSNNSSPIHRHMLGQNGSTPTSTKNGIMLNGGAKATNSINHNNNHTSSTHATTAQTTTRTSLFDSCHRKIRLIGGGPVAFLGGLVAKARRKERDGDQSSTDTKLYLEESVLERKLPDADLKALVDLPAGLDYNEWLASHTLALFEHVNLVYGTISEFCTPSGCPDMTGPGNRTYLWFDEKGKKTRVAAPQYIDYVMTFTQKTVSDESIFPTKYANEFPSSFESIARKILRLQFHVIAHLYAAHFREIALLGLHTHLNLTFAHLTALHRRFNLIDEKETDVLRDLEVALRLTDDGTSLATTGTSSSGNESTTSSTAGFAVTSMTGTVIGASEDVSLLKSGRIDGDASARPICTQPSSDQDARGGGGGGSSRLVLGAGSGGIVGGILGGFTSDLIDTGYCSNTSGGTICSSGPLTTSNTINSSNSSHIGNVLNFNNNHHSSTHTSMLQCNSSSSNNSSNNSPSSHTTTTA